MYIIIRCALCDDTRLSCLSFKTKIVLFLLLGRLCCDSDSSLPFSLFGCIWRIKTTDFREKKILPLTALFLTHKRNGERVVSIHQNGVKTSPKFILYIVPTTK